MTITEIRLPLHLLTLQLAEQLTNYLMLVRITEESSKRIMERYLYLQRLFNHYWKRWKQEYLHHLTVRNKWRKEEPPLQVGDIVLVSEDNVSRGKWPLARVTEVRPGRDGLVERQQCGRKRVF